MPRSRSAVRQMALSWRSQAPAAAVVLLAVACALLLRTPASPAAPAGSGGGTAQAAVGGNPQQVRDPLLCDGCCTVIAPLRHACVGAA